jgi:hypothetical protein
VPCHRVYTSGVQTLTGLQCEIGVDDVRVGDWQAHRVFYMAVTTVRVGVKDSEKGPLAWAEAEVCSFGVERTAGPHSADETS